MADKRLGRGLDFLIPSRPEVQVSTHLNPVATLPIRLIRKNRRQPRQVFDAQKIEELALSIKENGLVQPVLVRQDEGGYELIAGERRLRACALLEHETIPAIVLDVPEHRLLELALVENLQRQDLNAMEEAHAFQALLQSSTLTHDCIAKKVGRHRSYVSNSLRLLELPEEVQFEVSRETISAGHARALLGLSSHQEIKSMLQIVLKKALSVRDTEALINRHRTRKPATPSLSKTGKPPHLAHVEERLRDVFNARVEVQPRARGGVVSFTYCSDEDLARLYALWTADHKDSF